MTAVFLLLVFVDLPTIVIMVSYICMLVLILAMVPLLSMIAMDYIQEGKNVNFGLARGLGSLAYASSAVVLGQLSERINASTIAYVFAISAILLVILLHFLPDSQIGEVKRETKSESSVVEIIFRYRIFFFLLVGFSLMYGGATSLSTYLINIVTRLGGDKTLYGVGIFCMSSGELPIMAITPRLMKKYDSISLLMVAALAYIVRNVVICIAPSLPIVFLGLMIQSVSYGLFTGVITYYITEHLAKPDQMMGQTLLGIMGSGVGCGLGNFVGGVLQDMYGLSMLYVFCCIITVLGSAIVIMTGFISKQHVHNRKYIRKGAM
jgi:PPP family 3-phenylpropionic acid transporter